jgi:thymidylate kinase
MRLMMIGCEYAGKTTLAVEISKWMIEAMGLSFVRWHNHFVVPQVDQHLVIRGQSDDHHVAPGKGAADSFAEEEQEQIMALTPSLLEQFQRHMIWRHLHPNAYAEDDYLVINWYYADAVYAPLYYGYGDTGTFADRRQRARAWDAEVMKLGPDTVIVLVEASADVIRERMRAKPRAKGILQEKDVDRVLDRFREEYDNSLIYRRFTMDTTDASPEESLQSFLKQMWPHLSQGDRLRMLSRLETVSAGVSGSSI